MNTLSVLEEERVRAALDDLRHSDTPTNWLLFAYSSKNEIELVGAGEGGLDELKTQLGSNDIRYAVLEALVTGDEYNAVKYVLITWIGPDVSAGLAKARCAGHRQELLTFVQGSIAIAAEVQPANLDDLNTRDISAKLTRVAGSYQDTITVGQPKDKRQEMSRSHASAGDRVLSQLTLINENAINEALKSVHKEENDWVVLSYAPNQKDAIQLQAVGKGGLPVLCEQLHNDQVNFGLFSLKVTETTTTVTKLLLLTWIGENVKPLTKARSAAHRKELANYVITLVPFHSHYQAAAHDELTEQCVLFKLRS